MLYEISWTGPGIRTGYRDRDRDRDQVGGTGRKAYSISPWISPPYSYPRTCGFRGRDPLGCPPRASCPPLGRKFSFQGTFKNDQFLTPFRYQYFQSLGQYFSWFFCRCLYICWFSGFFILYVFGSHYFY